MLTLIRRITTLVFTAKIALQSCPIVLANRKLNPIQEIIVQIQKSQANDMYQAIETPLLGIITKPKPLSGVHRPKTHKSLHPSH